MARGVNKVILIGSLGQSPTAKALQNGTAVTTFSIATSDSWKDKNTGERKELTEWHNIVTYARLAEICDQYLTKGAKVYVEGSIHTRKWEDKKTGESKYKTEINATTVEILDAKKQDSDNSNSYKKESSKSAYANSQPIIDDFDDDIPF